MANNDQERTEQPTYRKKYKARQKGNVPKSSELRSAILILVSAMALKGLGGYFNVRLVSRFVESLGSATSVSVTAVNLPMIVESWLLWSFYLLAPLFLILSIVAIASCGATQGGFVLTTQALSLNLGKLNPIRGAKNLISATTFFNLLRDMVKIIIITFVCYGVVRDTIAIFVTHADIALCDMLSGAGGLVITLLYRSGLVLLALGLIDMAYQKRKYINDLKMSHREIKDEVKESEGDPLVKGRQRSAAQALARKRMMAAVPDADVVLTNPTEYAVALKYDPDTMSAPLVVAKGRRLIAQKIKEIAREAGVPVIENKYLARMLYRLSSIGGEVPVELYRAVAEVISFVYRQKGRMPSAPQTTEAR